MTAIDPSTVFPANVVGLLAIRLGQKLNIDVAEDSHEYVQVQQRPIHSLNAGVAVAVLPVDWSVHGDEEMGTFPRGANPLQQYGVIVQCLVSDWSEEAGIARLSLLSRRVRNTLISDRVLHQALQTLRCTEDEILEAFQSLKVQRQNFLVTENEEATGTLFLSTTEVAVVTEVIGPI